MPIILLTIKHTQATRQRALPPAARRLGVLLKVIGVTT